MIAKTYTCSLLGIDAILVEVEVDLASGFPGFATVGLPDNIVKESKDRVKAAIQNSGYPFPFERITVNLAPAVMKKEGAGFDLPIAVGILAALGIVNSDKAAKMIFCGELSLDSRVKPVAGCLPMAIQARDSGYSDIILVIALYTTPGSVKYPLVATPFGIYFAERGRRPARDIHVNSVGRQRGDFRPQTPGRPPYSRKSENRRRKTDVPYSVLVTPEVSSPGPQSSVFRASGKSLI